MAAPRSTARPPAISIGNAVGAPITAMFGVGDGEASVVVAAGADVGAMVVSAVVEVPTERMMVTVTVLVVVVVLVEVLMLSWADTSWVASSRRSAEKKVRIFIFWFGVWVLRSGANAIDVYVCMYVCMRRMGRCRCMRFATKVSWLFF